MSDPALLVALGSAGTVAVGITATAALKGWQDWLELRRLQIGGRRPRGRVELGELRDRVRRLEAIANGSE